jgi:hypothetical protein
MAKQQRRDAEPGGPAVVLLWAGAVKRFPLGCN